MNENAVCLIDSGSDKDSGRRVRQILDSNGWALKAIYVTHSNADHIGGNKYAQMGCKIYAKGIEKAFTEYPVLEPAFLYGGYPCGELKHRFLMAQESKVSVLTEEKLPEGGTMIPIDGHFLIWLDIGQRMAQHILLTAIRARVRWRNME